MARPASTTLTVALRLIAALLGVANLLAQVMFPAFPSHASLIATSSITTGLLCFAFFPRRYLSRWWFLIVAMALVALGLIVREAVEAASFQPDTITWAGFVVVGVVFVAMLVEALLHRARA